MEGTGAVAPGIFALNPPHPHWQEAAARSGDESDHHQDRRLCNRSYGLAGGYRDWVEFFVGQLLPEPHSSRQFETAVSWAMESSPEVILASMGAHDQGPPDRTAPEVLCRAVTCPVLVIHGDRDMCQPLQPGAAGGGADRRSVRVLEGSGHLPQASVGSHAVPPGRSNCPVPPGFGVVRAAAGLLPVRLVSSESSGAGPDLA